ncbi:hypothetical protein [Zhihengliuella salsuginis]|uniref:Coenzyme PQQ synthesis protein D (PqqD) n=1 Tax=Zhihengliuella salsuginis TaxID=578222 RepID=A0ABQ3GJ12_9MICC|nr:hypothetical protein [Zhihengliuella salsuginis]GHD09849.1 hypothetical protein GCM10008096_22920 [Zhihengliuella salsuginis]
MELRSAPSGPLAFTARVLDGRITATDLSRAEAEALAAAWSRCDPRLTAADAVAAEDRHGSLARRPQQGWASFHEELVYTATSRAIASGRGELLMFHAAALADPVTGRAIALVAESGTGKTTATRTLGRSFAYLTDETVAVDAARGIRPFPKPLSILPASGRRPKDQAAPDELGLLPAVDRSVLWRVAVLDRLAGRERAVARRLPLAEALEHLSPQISGLAWLDRGLVRLCSTLHACGGALRLEYGEATQLAELARDLLAAPPADEPGDAWAPLDLSRSETPADPALLQYRRIVPADAVRISTGSTEAVAVLKGEALTVLHGLGPLLWGAASAWRTTEELLETVVAAAGDHPQARELLDAHVADLVGHGLLEASREVD